MKSSMTKTAGYGLMLVLILLSVSAFFPGNEACACDQCTRIKIRNSDTGSPAGAGTTASTADKVVLRKARAEEIGKTRTCLVTGEMFTVGTSTDVAEYRGATCYFCSAACTARFQAAPGKYVKI